MRLRLFGRRRFGQDDSVDRKLAQAAAHRKAVVAWMPRSPFNPYPKMLYRGLGDAGLGVLGIDAHEMDQVCAAAVSSGTSVVFHQHWTGWVLGDEAVRSKAEDRLDQAFRLFDAIAGSPLIWTLHNAMPHECPHPDLEQALRRRLAAQADLIHIMNPLSAELVAEFYELPTAKLRTLPHPDYRSIYPPLPDRSEARTRLAIDVDATWLAFIGQVREYKNLPLLLDALERTPGVQLLVAGATGSGPAATEASNRAANSPSIVRIDAHLSDAELMDVLAASNAVVLPYDRLLNSGIIALARSFGRRLVAPDAEGVRAIADQASTQYFEPGNLGSFARALAAPHNDPAPSSRGGETPTRFAELVATLVD